MALVTGGASGIGREAALLFAARGARVLVGDVDETGGGETADAIESAGGEARFLQTDVSDPGQVQSLVATAVAIWGQLDVAFNNAGISGTFAPLPDQPLDDWNRVLAVNLTSVFVCMQSEIPAMLESGGGAIVNTSSAAGLMGFANLPAYVATKHGVVGLTKAIALEYASQGIRVNAICPGTIHTPMLEDFAGSAKTARDMGSMAPVGRVGLPDEIAEVAVWLCSDAASYVTGHAMAVDGGVLAT